MGVGGSNKQRAVCIYGLVARAAAGTGVSGWLAWRSTIKGVDQDSDSVPCMDMCIEMCIDIWADMCVWTCV